MGTQEQAVLRTAKTLPRPPVTRIEQPRRLWLPLTAGLAVLAVLGWQVAGGRYYTAGSDFGYNLGLVGGMLMLILLLYPLRKHVRFMDRLGATRHWFRVHMVIGVLAPTLIMFHSTFHLGSVNATVAFLCMLLVAGSGLVGRFIYRKIHHGLYGRAATLQEIQTKLGMSDGEVRSRFHFAPEMTQHLLQFEAEVLAQDRAWYTRLWRFLTVGLQARLAAYRAGRELELAARIYGLRRGWDELKLRRRLRQGRSTIHAHLRAVVDVARFRAYERLFSAWHILHVPFVLLLVVSGIVHVVAVHMY
jgi:hypothetical protein